MRHDRLPPVPPRTGLEGMREFRGDRPPAPPPVCRDRTPAGPSRARALKGCESAVTTSSVQRSGGCAPLRSSACSAADELRPNSRRSLQGLCLCRDARAPRQTSAYYAFDAPRPTPAGPPGDAEVSWRPSACSAINAPRPNSRRSLQGTSSEGMRECRDDWWRAVPRWLRSPRVPWLFSPPSGPK
jgi:hypothetical protein